MRVFLHPPTSTQHKWYPQRHVRISFALFPTRQEGVVRFYVGIRVCDASTPRPHPVSLASGSRRVSRQSCSPVDPAQYPARAARQWIPPSIPPAARPPSIPRERLASGSRRVSRQSCSSVDPAQYPARAARQWIPPSIPPELLVRGSRPVSRQSGSPVDPAQNPARAAGQWIPPSIPRQWVPRERLAVGIPLSIAE